MKRRLYYNGHILTMNNAEPLADYVLTEDDRIADLGKSDRIQQYLSEGAEGVDLQGRLMLPGFIDSHIHMLTAALNRFKLDISGMTFGTVDDMLRYVQEKKQGTKEPWISVFGFSEENIGTGQMVTRSDIDRFFPHVPVTVIRVCGHMCIINSSVIERLDKEKMESVAGGAFKKDDRGAYTGLATEGAQQYVLDNMPSADQETVLAFLAKEQELLLQNGITAIHDAGTDMMPPREYVKVYEEMNRRSLLKLRTYLMIRPGENEPFEDFCTYADELRAGHKGDPYLRIGSVKLFSDGSFGSRTAALNAPYMGEPENTGLLLRARLDQYIRPSADAGWQVAVHAIGDRSTGYVADLYSGSEKKKTDRLRIEHAELLNDSLIETIRKNHILIMTQPIFIREFGNTYLRNLGEERAMHIQPIRTLLKNGINVGFGTDYPVDDPNPLLGIRTAMTREIGDSGKPLNRTEAISFLEAVKCYTIRNAYGAFCEDSMGSIERGKYADFAILSGIEAGADGEIRDIAGAVVEMTVIGGKTVFLKGN